MSARTDVATPPLTYCISAGAASSGIWLGMGTARVAMLGIGLLAGILAVTAGAPPWAAIIPVLATAMLAAARIGGRPALDWVAPLVTHRGDVTSGSARWRAGVPSIRPLPVSKDGAVRLSVPGEFGRPRVMTCPDDPGIGMITDATTTTITVIFDVCGVDRFPLLDPAERDTLILGWGDALAVLADTDDALTRLQLIERTRPSDDAPDPVPDQAPADGCDWQREITALATTHETRLVAQWTFARLDPAALAVIAVRCHLLCRGLLSARLLARPLTAEEVIADVRGALTGPPTPAHAATGWASVSRRTDWTHVRIDDRLHRTFAVSGWPSAPVGAAWLSPLLLAAPDGVTRTVSLHLEPLPPSAAARIARSRRAKASLDQADRVRFGMTSSAALDNVEASGVAMDAELAAGYRTHRLVGLVTVSGDNLAGLDDAGRVLRQAAAVCRVELRPLHGQHDVGLAATAPLCRLRPRGQS